MLEDLVLASPNYFELFVPRRFSLVVLRLKSAKADDKDANDLNKRFFALTAERKDIHLTPTTVGGKSCTRIAIGSPHT